MKTTFTFSTAYVCNDASVYIAAFADVDDVFAKRTILFQWDPELARELGGDNPWTYKIVDWRACAVTTFIPDDFPDGKLCALSEEGDVLFTEGRYVEEKIPGAGVYSENAGGWGYLADVQQIGDSLYACGYRGQVYKRFGPNDWRHVDSGLLQAPDTAMQDSIALSVINGFDENTIYAAGYQHTDWLPPKVFFYNGQQWRELALPDGTERITNMCLTSESRIWMCGANGTLLHGNAMEGFRNLSSPDDNQLFTSVCKFQDKIYLGSNMGLFVYDPQKPEHGIKSVFTNLMPNLQDANIVDRFEHVLWSIGPKDIARFDGRTWRRIHHPDNPPIGID